MGRTAKGQTALHVAVEMAESKWLNRDYDYGLCVKLLLAAGADVNATDAVGNTPLHVGIQGLVVCFECCAHNGAVKQRRLYMHT